MSGDETLTYPLEIKGGWVGVEFHNESSYTIISVTQKFSDLGSFGIWADRTESDEDIIRGPTQGE